MEWFTHLSSKWQRVMIATMLVVIMIGIAVLKEMIVTEETEAEREKGQGVRHLVRKILDATEPTST